MKIFRMFEWLIIALFFALLASAGIAYSTTDLSLAGKIVGHLSTGVWKLALVSAGAYSAYWIDARVFRYARPDMFLAVPWKFGEMPIVATGKEILFAAAMQRRSILMAGVAIAVGLGA